MELLHHDRAEAQPVDPAVVITIASTKGIVMFDNLLAHGSWQSVILMSYVTVVMTHIARIGKFWGSFNLPPIIDNPVASIIMIGAAPCIIWPGIYVGLFDGFVAGLVTFVFLPLPLVVLAFSAGLRSGYLLWLHFITASIAYPIGYFLSFSNLPG